MNRSAEGKGKVMRTEKGAQEEEIKYEGGSGGAAYGVTKR